MYKVGIDDVMPYMVLAATVKDRTGSIIFLKGVALTEKHIAMLKSKGVRKVIVEGERSGLQDSRTVRLCETVEKRFSAAGPHPAVLRLKLIVKELLC